MLIVPGIFLVYNGILRVLVQMQQQKHKQLPNLPLIVNGLPLKTL